MPIRHRASEPRRSYGDDDSFILRLCPSRGSGQAGQGLLRVGDDARGVRSRNGTRGTVHFALRGHGHLAGKIANHQIQGVDANRPCALVGRAVTGNGNIRALVRAAFVSEIDLLCVIQRSEIEDRPDLPAFHFECPCSTQSSTIGDAANPGRPTVSRPATLTPVGYLQFENGALFAEDSIEFSVSVLSRLELFLQSEPLAISQKTGRRCMKNRSSPVCKAYS